MKLNESRPPNPAVLVTDKNSFQVPLRFAPIECKPESVLSSPILAGLNVFNEASYIKKCLNEIYPHVARIIIVDGAYQWFPVSGDHGASDDGTLGIIRDYPDPNRKITLIEAEGPWESEITKLNRILDHGHPGAWIFRIDPDERVVGDWTAARSHFAHASSSVVGFSVPFVETGGNRYKWFRVVRWRADLRYRENHWRLFYGDVELTNYDSHPDHSPKPVGPYHFETLKGLTLVHQEHHPDREALKRQYYADPRMR